MSNGASIQTDILDFADVAKRLGVTVDPTRAALWFLGKYPGSDHTISEISGLIEQAAIERDVPILGIVGEGRT
jgi:hypothetical protein